MKTDGVNGIEAGYRVCADNRMRRCEMRSAIEWVAAILLNYIEPALFRGGGESLLASGDCQSLKKLLHWPRGAIVHFNTTGP
jgi:hypothetical protein